jgi:hypothetical protein
MAIRIMPEEYKGSDFGKDDSFLSLLEPKANPILAVSIGLLVLSLALWGGLWWYKDSIIQETTLITDKITTLQSQRDVKVEEALIELDKTIKSLDDVLKDRIYPANIFGVLEDLVLPEVFFSSFSSDVSGAAVSIDVTAKNYRVLAEQMIVFKESRQIENVEFSSINLGDEGYASANFDVELDPNLLKQDILLEL